MTAWIRWSVVALSLSFSFPAFGESERSLAERLYRQSGMEVQFAAMPAQFVEGITASKEQWGARTPLPENFATVLAAQVKHSFDLSRFRETVIGRLEKGLSAGQMTSVLDWLASPVGVRMTRLEEAASKATMQENAAYARAIAKSPPPSRYVAQVRELMRAVKAIESTVESMLMMQVGIVSAAVAASPAAGPETLDAALVRLEAARPQLQQMVGDHVAVTFLRTYDDATAADLDAYVVFATSSHGEAYHRVAFDGMALGLRDVSLDVGKAVAALVKRYLEQKQS